MKNGAVQLISFALVMGVAACGGGGGGGSSTSSSGGSASTCTEISTSSYTISWNAVTDGDLNGYRAYYGTTSPLTKGNSAGNVAIPAGTTSVNITPSDYGVSTCFYVGISSVGNTKTESALSTEIAVNDSL